MKKLCVAVLGGRLLGAKHARIFNELPNTELVAVCDVDSKEPRPSLKSLA